MKSLAIINTKDAEHEPSKLLLARLLKGDKRTKLETTGLACDIRRRFTICVSIKPVIIDTTNDNITVHIPSNDKTMQIEIQSVQPYAGHRDKTIIRYITPIEMITGNQPSPHVCKFNHQDPAAIFSSGFTGNVLHEFSDIIISLFVTTKHLKSRVQLVLGDYNSRFVDKYKKVMSRLSTHEITLRRWQRKKCALLPGAIVELRFHGHMTLNPGDVPEGTSIRDFRKILRESYGLNFTHVSQN